MAYWIIISLKMNRKRPGNFWANFVNSNHSVTGEPLHTYTYRAAHCGKDVGLYFHFIQLFPDNNTNICRTVPQQGGPVWWIPTSLANYSAPYKGVRLPVGSFYVSTKGSYYILTTAGFSYLAQRFLCDSRNLTQKSCEIVWCQIVFVWFQVIKGAFPKLLNE